MATTAMPLDAAFLHDLSVIAQSESRTRRLVKYVRRLPGLTPYSNAVLYHLLRTCSGRTCQIEKKRTSIVQESNETTEQIGFPSHTGTGHPEPLRGDRVVVAPDYLEAQTGVRDI